MFLRNGFYFFIICGLIVAQANARTSGEIKDELKEITDKIQTLDKKNTKQRSALGKLESQIETLERKISNTARSKSELQQKLTAQQQKLKTIEAEYSRTQQSINHHQRLLASHLRALHRLNYKPGFELLDRGNTVHNNLTRTWFQYLQQARRKAISELSLQSQNLKNISKKQASTLNQLKFLERDLELHTRRLAKQKKQRAETVSKLASQLKTTQGELEQLRQNQAKLNKVLKKLRKTLADPAFSVQGKVAFAKLRGKLPWPIKGKVSTVQDSKGVRIKANSGLPVHAISAGRIVYADWLRGFGLLTIIDHGSGYMSLYGHNESLYKQVGDWVDPGTVISTTGNSGGQQSSGLYFEIRHNSKPLSTKKWCKNT
ncbi:MAG TPA: hypothetical protein EYH06_13895 [Chromatiales bacterium]|nr:hypothetical protein [Thiotrichales bacterium]HIP69658.1 hypothetical protein [Chromatiales bacterium]